jgi:hypothetical protein
MLPAEQPRSAFNFAAPFATAIGGELKQFYDATLNSKQRLQL